MLRHWTESNCTSHANYKSFGSKTGLHSSTGYEVNYFTINSALYRTTDLTLIPGHLALKKRECPPKRGQLTPNFLSAPTLNPSRLFLKCGRSIYSGKRTGIMISRRRKAGSTPWMTTPTFFGKKKYLELVWIHFCSISINSSKIVTSCVASGDKLVLEVGVRWFLQ